MRSVMLQQINEYDDDDDDAARRAGLSATAELLVIFPLCCSYRHTCE